MRKIIDQNILDLFEGLFLSLQDNLDVFVADAQALMAIFMILYFANKAYGMMVADVPLEIMPMLKPFGLALVVIFWGSFIDLVNIPGEVITDTSRAMFDDRVEKVDAMQLKRLELIDKVAERLIMKSAEVEEVKSAAENNNQESVGVLGIDLSKIFDSMKGYYIMIMAKFRYYAVQLIESGVLTLFQVFSYLIFFLQIIFAGILIVLGPFAFAFSVIPGFRDAYIQWIARYFSVSLYSAIGYIIMSFSMTIVQYAMEREIDVLQFVLKDEYALMGYVTAIDGGGSAFFVTSLLIGGLAMLSVPVISTWIVSTSGVGNAINSITRGAGRLV